MQSKKHIDKSGLDDINKHLLESTVNFHEAGLLIWRSEYGVCSQIAAGVVGRDAPEDNVSSGKG
jgi:hypothetical protein